MKFVQMKYFIIFQLFVCLFVMCLFVFVLTGSKKFISIMSNRT